MTKITLVRVWLCAVALSLGALAGPALSGETIKLKIGFVNPEADSYIVAAKLINEELKKRTNGRLELEIFHSGQIGNEREMYEGAQIGSIDICTVVNAVISSFIPEMAVLDQPFLFNSNEEATKIIKGRIGKMAEEKILQQGVHVVGWIESDFRVVFCNRPINALADFRGLKLRVMENPIQVDTWNALGLVATPMAFPEVFTALQQKTIDGSEGTIVNVLTNRFFETTPHIVQTKHLFSFMAVGVSDRAWNRIPEDLRPIFLEVMQEGWDHQHKMVIEMNAEAANEMVEKYGVTVHTPDIEPFKKAIEPVMVNYRKEMDQEWLKILDEELEAIRKGK